MGQAARALDAARRAMQTWRMGISGRLLLGCLLLCSAVAARAEDAPICPDRPGKGTGTCVVPKGAVQVETGVIDWTHDKADGVTSEATAFGSTLVKYGLGGRADIELGFTPLLTAHSTGSRTTSGVGDLQLRVKYLLTSDDAKVAVALDPFVKIPTASHGFGNGKVEGGLAVPIGVALGGPLSLALTPEVDWLADTDGSGHHLAMVQVAGLGVAASPRLAFGVELWGQWDYDPGGTGRQASADGSVTYLLNKDVQLDAGTNFGLNDQTADVEVYAGVSVRF